MPASVYRRRRAAVLVAAVVLLAAAAWACSTAVSALAGPAEPAPASPTAPAAAAGTTGDAVWVVQPGETLWSIATELRPDADPRPLVDELARRSGGAQVHAGQRIPLGGLDG